MSISEWKEVKLCDVVDVLGDGLHGTPKYENNGEYYFINGNNLNKNIVIDDTTKKVNYEEYLKYKKELNERTILLSINGTIGKIALYNGEKVILGKSACYFNVITDVDKLFVMYTMMTDHFKQYSQNYATGTTIKNLGLKQIREFKFVLPPIEEQRAIAATLSALDDKIELNNRINKTLEEMAQALFKRWFVDFEFPDENGQPYKSSGGEMVESELGLIPKGWKTARLSDVCNVLSGGTPKTGVAEYWNGPIPFFSPKDAGDGFYTITTEKTITDEGLKKCNSKLYPKDTVFITARGTVGKVVLSGRDMAMNQSCYALQGREGIGQYFLFFHTVHAAEQLRKSASGAVFDAIIVKSFDSIKVVVPPTCFLESFCELVHSLLSNVCLNTEQNNYLSSLRDTILPKLVSGEIRVPIEEVAAYV